MKSFNTIAVFALVVITALSSCKKENDGYNWKDNPPVTNGPVTNNPPSNGPTTAPPTGDTTTTPAGSNDHIFNPAAYKPQHDAIKVTDCTVSGEPNAPTDYDAADDFRSRASSTTIHGFLVVPDMDRNAYVDGSVMGVNSTVWIWVYSNTYGYIQCAVSVQRMASLSYGQSVAIDISLDETLPFSVMGDPTSAYVGQKMADYSHAGACYGRIQ